MKWIVNLENFHGYAHTLIDGDRCPCTGKTVEDFEREGFTALDDDEFSALVDRHNDSLCGNWSEISEDDYNYALDVLPPLRWKNGGFYSPELWSHNVSSFYQEWHGRYYTSLQKLSTPREEILNHLKAFVSA